MYIHRHIESVIERIALRKSVLVITGARQVGKSTMLKEVYRDLSYITLDNPLVRQSALTSPSIFLDINKPPLVLDEIQKAAGLFEYIKVMVDEEKRKGQFYLTGSQSLTLMKNVSDSLAGRAGVVKMLGFSLRELTLSENRAPFCPQSAYAPGNDSLLPTDRIIEIIHKGSFPELYETPSDLHDWADFYSAYFQTYIEKDVQDVLQIKDESAFIKFVKATAAHTGQILNFTTLAEICGKDIKTVKSWLSVLESSGLVYLLSPYYNNLNKRLIKAPKLYFLDTGLTCWLLGWNTPQQMQNGAMWGHIFETFAFTEVLKSYYNDGNVRPPLYYYRDVDKNEIDLIIVEGDTLYPIEIKSTGDPTIAMVKSFVKLNSIPGIKIGPGAVICLAKQRLPLNDQVWMMPIGMV